MKLRDWHTRAAVVLFDAFLLLLILNLVLYPIMRARRPAIPQTQQVSFDLDRLQKAYPGLPKQDVKTLFRETTREKQYEYEPFTEFRPTPFRGEFVNVAPAGFRFSKDQAPWPPRPQITNVFVFGGSTTFGAGLPDDETIASYLQEFATADHSAPPLAVYNFARPAYFSSQELILFQ